MPLARSLSELAGQIHGAAQRGPLLHAHHFRQFHMLLAGTQLKLQPDNIIVTVMHDCAADIDGIIAIPVEPDILDTVNGGLIFIINRPDQKIGDIE